eukprot:scaffold115_cov304-Prasinococcus_capsulatus_cf.AAC.39
MKEGAAMELEDELPGTAEGNVAVEVVEQDEAPPSDNGLDEASLPGEGLEDMDHRAVGGDSTALDGGDFDEGEEPGGAEEAEEEEGEEGEDEDEEEDEEGDGGDGADDGEAGVPVDVEMAGHESDEEDGDYNEDEEEDDGGMYEQLLHRLIATSEDFQIIAAVVAKLGQSAVMSWKLDEQDDMYSNTPLVAAICAQRLDVVRLLLDAGASVEKRVAGTPPLQFALQMMLVEGSEHPVSSADEVGVGAAVVQCLLEHGALAVAINDRGQSSLHVAASFGLDDMLNKLIAGVPQVAPTEEQSAEAEGNGSFPRLVVPPVLRDEAINARDRSGNTPLHTAACWGYKGCVFSLIEAGADAQAVNRRGENALHVAAASGYGDVAYLLIACEGLDTMQDNFGNTPKDCASKAKQTHVLPIFEGNSPLEPPQMAPTLIIHHAACEGHMTCDSSELVSSSRRPPENPLRIAVLLEERLGVLRSSLFNQCIWAEAQRAELADVLRVHEFSYVKQVQLHCAALGRSMDPEATGHLDGDTSISMGTFNAAMYAAGSVCQAVDYVMEGQDRNSFCCVRPPGHHAGPTGGVKGSLDGSNSLGFCILSNVAIGAAYAMNVYRHQIKKVAIVDFDVHHGNGTQACVSNVVPSVRSHSVNTPLCDVQVKTPSCKPWLGDQDQDNILFESVQGFGKIGPPGSGSYFYPGSGSTFDSSSAGNRSTVGPSSWNTFEFESAEKVQTAGPRVLNIGMPAQRRPKQWRRAYRDHVLPVLDDFKPDLLLVSAGFDAHKKDFMNHNMIGVDEEDYAWITMELMKIASKHCRGRLVSVLEGGYNLDGRMLSPFAQSVAIHVRTLSKRTREEWTSEEGEIERKQEEEREALKRAREEAELAALKNDAAAAMPGVEEAGTAPEMVGNDESGRRSKRARAEVNYEV